MGLGYWLSKLVTTHQGRAVCPGPGEARPEAETLSKVQSAVICREMSPYLNKQEQKA